jgi:hypothetical protein
LRKAAIQGDVFGIVPARLAKWLAGNCGLERKPSGIKLAPLSRRGAKVHISVFSARASASGAIQPFPEDVMVLLMVSSISHY